MKKNIKLYIDNLLTDIRSTDLQYVITKQIQDYNDITKRVGDFSYTIKIPRTSTNKTIFKNIDNIDIANKFNKTLNYNCSLYIDDILMIEGLFILRNINENNFEGNIVNKFGDIFAKFGDKTLQDINLTEIDFEGLQVPFTKNILDDSTNFVSPTNDCLNKDLCFDFKAFLESKKTTGYGYKNSSLDLTNLYSVNLHAYSNFFLNNEQLYSNSSTTTNLSYNFNVLPIYNLSLDDLIPSNKLMVVLKQMFKDIDYDLYIENDLINDLNIMIPYFGNEYPNWNWKHLAKCEYYTNENDIQIYQYNQSPTTKIGFFEKLRYPIINSNWNKGYSDLNFGYYTNTYPPLGEGHKTKNLFKLNIGDVKQFTNTTNTTLPDDINYFDCKFKKSENDLDNLMVHSIPVTRCKYDPLNSFDFYKKDYSIDSNIRGVGNWYIAPCDGEFEFELDILHFIFYSNNYKLDGSLTDNQDWDYNHYNNISKTIAGYNDSTNFKYKYKEKYLASNAVMFIKDDLNNNYDSESNFVSENMLDSFNNLQQNGYTLKTDKTYKRLSNFNDQNIIAFYHPMLRDLYMGDVGQTYEQFIEKENSIYKKDDTYSKTEFDRDKYFGFNLDTTILNYENNITTVYSDQTNEEQKKRKLVQLGELTTLPYLNYPADIFSGSVTTHLKYASGIVNFKFKTKLKRGERIRLVYVTTNQFKQMAIANSNTIPSRFDQVILPNNFCTGQENNDKYTDQVIVNKLKISCISEEYSTKLKLQNFLPKLKQKDFISDFIKYNNLYFDIDNNNIILKARKEYYSNQKSFDLTNKVDSSQIQIEPVETFKETRYGFKPSDTEDLANLINVNNKQIYYTTQNIYNNQNIKDVTSNIFTSTSNRDFKIDRLGFHYSNSSGFVKVYMPKKYDNISLSNFTENSDIFKPQNEVDFTYDRTPRLVYQSSNKINLTYLNSNDIEYGKYTLINNTPFVSYIPLRIGTTSSDTKFLNNEIRFNKLFNDKFLDLNNSSLVTYYLDLNERDLFEIKLNNIIYINNTSYYIQKIDSYDCLNKSLTKLILLKL